MDTLEDYAGNGYQTEHSLGQLGVVDRTTESAVGLTHSGSASPENGSSHAAKTFLDTSSSTPVTLQGQGLRVRDVVRVARENAPMRITDSPEVLDRVQASYEYIQSAVRDQVPIYGVTTGFGGMAHQVIPGEQLEEFQNNAMWTFKVGAGEYMPVPCIRAAMLLRANSHLLGASGLRLELIRRLEIFLNEGVTPYVPALGSIGASGDVIPLNYIVGAAIGHDEAFVVDFKGERVGCQTALQRLGLPRLRLQPKEGLAMFNGTSVMTGTAMLCLADVQSLLAVALGTHALFIQGFYGTNQSFHPFIHSLKPHSGQICAAQIMLDLLAESSLVRDELNGQHDHRQDDLIQDRYALRCLPQYLGPIIEGFRTIADQLETEANSANDNPLIDAKQGVSYHGGNFLGEYVSVGMDQLRFYLGLIAKHLDVQIAFISSEKFNGDLAPCLIGNTAKPLNLGLKGLQMCGNSIMPLITYLGQPIADRYPTHAEQFNQNINSQGYGSVNLARQSIELCQSHMAISLMFAVQAVDLRTFRQMGHYDARVGLSQPTVALYEAVRSVVGVAISRERPYIWDDNEQFLDEHIRRIAADIAANGKIPQALSDITARLSR